MTFALVVRIIWTTFSKYECLHLINCQLRKIVAVVSSLRILQKFNTASQEGLWLQIFHHPCLSIVAFLQLIISTFLRFFSTACSILIRGLYSSVPLVFLLKFSSKLSVVLRIFFGRACNQLGALSQIWVKEEYQILFAAHFYSVFTKIVGHQHP